MIQSEFYNLITTTSKRFSNLKSFRRNKTMDTKDILLRVIGELFYAHINQNNHIPKDAEFDLNDIEDEDEFYYDFQNHIVNTTELFLADAFIDLCILAKRLKWQPRDKNSNSDVFFGVCKTSNYSHVIFELMTVIPEDLQFISNQEICEKYLYKMLLMIVSLSERCIEFDLKKVLDFKYRAESYDGKN